MATKQHASQRTTDHETIRRWAEERKGSPASVTATEHGGAPGVLRIDFPGGTGEGTLEHISWDAFFQKFDGANLAMVYQEKTADGKQSYFCKFVSREPSE